MIYRIVHKTSYTYSPSVRNKAFEIRILPGKHPAVKPERSRINTVPASRTGEAFDPFGNRLIWGGIKGPIDRFVVEAEILARIEANPSHPPLTPFETFAYTRPSSMVLYSPLLEDFIKDLDPGCGSLEGLDALCRLLHERFSYKTGVTTSSDTSDVLLRMGRGVCQDFAHLFIAVVRYFGVPARYIGGYLYSAPDNPAMTANSSAGHAWAEVWIEGLGWAGFDPSNGRRADLDYVPVAAGRDYNDAAPLRGIHSGNTEEEMSVFIRIDALK